jgi:hypothetical protein
LNLGNFRVAELSVGSKRAAEALSLGGELILVRIRDLGTARTFDRVGALDDGALWDFLLHGSAA